MSRVSLHKRLAAIRDKLLQPGTLEHAVYHLSDDERERYTAWRSECDAIAAKASTNCPGTTYERMINGDLAPMPELWPESLAAKIFPANASGTDDPQTHYEWMLKQ